MDLSADDFFAAPAAAFGAEDVPAAVVPAAALAGAAFTGEVLVAEDFAVTRWTAHSRQPDGSVLEVRACDVFEFEGDRIKVKDTYRKVAGPLPAT